MACKCGGEYILDGSWYVCQECHEVAGDFSEYEDDEEDLPDDYTDLDYENDCRVNGGQG